MSENEAGKNRDREFPSRDLCENITLDKTSSACDSVNTGNHPEIIGVGHCIYCPRTGYQPTGADSKHGSEVVDTIRSHTVCVCDNLSPYLGGARQGIWNPPLAHYTLRGRLDRMLVTLCAHCRARTFHTQSVKMTPPPPLAHPNSYSRITRERMEPASRTRVACILPPWLSIRWRAYHHTVTGALEVKALFGSRAPHKLKANEKTSPFPTDSFGVRQRKQIEAKPDLLHRGSC
ncbi:hypothetical protein RRG08_030717 [Elysia crispata]|uniref:Uncharacterized protein n=1 Tax=Elysia crispata TaxID=231223 RepID=A0AAE0Y5T6_9GAST|nr:hypothetical protein RRG08_030717 [Elysia crispata]